MIDVVTVERYMRDANPLPQLDDINADEFAGFVAAAHTRRAALMQAPTQHPTETTPTTVQAPKRRTRRVWAFAAAFVIVLLGVGAAALLLGGEEQPVVDEPAPPTTVTGEEAPRDDLAIATEIAKQWTAAWLAQDPGAAAALFTEDGVYTNPVAGQLIGRAEIEFYVASHDHMVQEAVPGTGHRSDSGTFIFPFRRLRIADEGLRGQIEIALDGELASRIDQEWESTQGRMGTHIPTTTAGSG